MNQEWINANLGEAFSLIRNGVNCSQNKSGIGDKISRIETIAFSNVDPGKVGYASLTAEQKDKYKINKGDILFSHINSVPHVGKTAFFDTNYEIYHGINLLLIRAENFIEPQFLQYYLKRLFLFGYWKKLCKQSVNQASVNQTDIKGVPFNYPLISEQKRIVTKLDECFEAIDKARSNVEKNLNNAKELFQSQLNQIFSQKGDEYETKSFGDVCEIIGGSQPSKQMFVYEPQEGYVRLIQVRDYRTDKFMTYIPKDKTKKFCSKDDIMIGRYGPPIFGIFSGIDGAYNVALMKAVPDEKLLYKNYFRWFLKNKDLHKFVEKSSARAAGQSGVRKELLYAYPVPIPTLDFQKEIVNQLDELKSQTQTLESNYQQELDALDELKKSILQKAFNGEL